MDAHTPDPYGCPKCGGPMIETEASHPTFDRCSSRRGVWIDYLALSALFGSLFTGRES